MTFSTLRRTVSCAGVVAMSEGSPAVRVRGLVKSYGSVPTVRGIDLDIWPGEIFARLGPNGAGKTNLGQ